ncbi:MAG: FAD:protein FMN transferase, partial [Actinobacteria bacterium]
EPSLAQTLPSEAGHVIAAADALEVTHDGPRAAGARGDYFSSALLGVSKLYDFEGRKSVPPTDVARTAASWEFGQHLHGEAYFGPRDPALYRASITATMLAHPPGLDFGGSAKGLALDRAAKVLRESGVVDAALVTAGSTTVTFGEKPESEPWRIGVEDPREPGRVVAVVEASSTVTVSTSGDYQQHFERDGINWHHILDPVTGRPAWGLRSLTVIGAPDGLTSDILSTALFVMGPVRAVDYAREKDLGLYMIDAVGEVTTVGPVPGARWRLVEEAESRE